FDVGPALHNGKRDRASIYIQGWHSWRAQPRLRFGEHVPVNPQRSSHRQHPEGAAIDSLAARADGGMSVRFGSDRLEVTTAQVDVYLSGQVWPVTITDGAALAPDNAPDAIVQDRAKVLVDFGFEGQAEIRDNQVAVQRRFL